MREFTIEDNGLAEVDNADDGTGLNAEDDAVLAALTTYKHYILPTGKMPESVTMPGLENVPYDPDSEYAKHTKNKKETWFTKFTISYPTTPIISSKYVGVRGVYLDLIPRPELMNNKPNTFGAKYATVYFPTAIIDSYKQLIEKGGI